MIRRTASSTGSVASPSWTIRLVERSSGSISPVSPPEPHEGCLVIAHDDPGIRAADKVAAMSHP
jgi:hypothetical protein